MVKYEELYEIAKEKLSEKRFNHTLGVVKRAIQYAEIYNENMEKTKIAAILHDIAKEIPKEESYNMLEKYEVKLDDIEKRNFNLIHSILGAEIAKNEYNYVSLKWYKKYLSFVDQIEVENRNKLRKIGINPNEIEAEIEE